MVIGYLRVSTTNQDPGNQKNEISRYAEKNDIEISTWVTDTISGKADWKKRNLGRVVKKLKEGDTLIVTEISRLSRSLHEIMTIMKYCVDNKIIIYSTKDGYTFDESINSKVLSFAFGLAAEIEHKLISQRTKEALTHLKAQGKILGRRKGSGEKMKTLIQNKENILQFLQKGNTLSWICKRYNVSYRTFYRFRDSQKDISEFFEQKEIHSLSLRKSIPK